MATQIFFIFIPNLGGRIPNFDDHIFQMGFCSKPPTSDAFVLFLCGHLDGGFKYLLFSSLPGEMIQFNEHIFQMGWFGSTTNQSSWCPKSNIHLHLQKPISKADVNARTKAHVWFGREQIFVGEKKRVEARETLQKWPWWRRQ